MRLLSDQAVSRRELERIFHFVHSQNNKQKQLCDQGNEEEVDANTNKVRKIFNAILTGEQTDLFPNLHQEGQEKAENVVLKFTN